jgi:hypothetical protein
VSKYRGFAHSILWIFMGLSTLTEVLAGRVDAATLVGLPASPESENFSGKAIAGRTDRLPGSAVEAGSGRQAPVWPKPNYFSARQQIETASQVYN